MATLASLIVKIGADASGFSKNVQGAQKTLNSFKQSAMSLGRDLTTKVTLPFLAVSGAAIKMASDAEEVQSKFNVVFGEMAQDANQWAIQFADSVGRARTDVKSWMSTLQDTFVPLGYARDEASDMSKTLTQLAVDVASFNNAADADVIRDFQSAIVGNHETVRKYGVIITEAALKQEAYSSGIAKVGEKLSEQQKVQARMQLLIKGTTDAQGDAIRTAGSFANQLKALKADIKNAGEAIGKELMPYAAKLISVIRNAVHWFTSLDDKTKKLILTIAGVVAVVGPLIMGAGALAAALSFLLTPIGLLIAAGIALYKNWDKVSYYALQAWGYIKMVVLDAIHSILIGLEKFTKYIPVLNSKVTEAREKVGRMIDHERITLSARKAGYEMAQLEKQIRSTTENVTQQVPALNSNIKSMFSAADAANSMAKAQGELAKKTDEVTKALARLDARTREWVKRVGYPIGKSKEYLRQLGAAMKLKHELKLDIDYSKIGIPISQEKLPKFAAGGIVPGPIGKPQLAVVHGGEEIIPPRQSGPKTANITIYLDGRQIARAIGQPLTDEVRIRTGVRI